MFHTIAFWESIDQGGVNQELAAALGEQVLFISGDDIRVPGDVNQIIAAAANVALNANFGRLISPSLRSIIALDILPVNSLTDGAVEPGTPQAVMDLRTNPIPLAPSEALNAQSDANPTAAAAQSIIVWLADGPVTPVTGVPIFPLRCTSAITCVAGAWTNGQLVFAQDLPAGSYQVVGFRAQGATCIAARLAFRGGAVRPGTLGTDLESDLEHPMFRYGGLGIWGEFEVNTPPTVDVLANAADTAQEYVIDLVRVG